MGVPYVSGTRMNISAHSGQYKIPENEISYREGGQKRLYIVILLCAIIGLLAVRRYFKSQDHAIDQIANHPELSDEKADAIARISTKQHKIFKKDS